MELHIKQFEELTVYELYEILKLRSAVFVVEQKSRYLDTDDMDQDALHVFLTDGDEIVAYLRILSRDSGETGYVKIGRVIAKRRRMGLGTDIVLAGIRTARQVYKPEKIKIAAQTYTKEFYERLGFVKTPDDEYDIDGIPHINMELDMQKS
ncbi:MAG: GNAT family N-acetyltransferase [Clostridia bacterium]|nr:GNAT family N-acetyltransferase [Clostridia bacterium]